MDLLHPQLAAFAAVPLLNKYDVYQVLMEYWEEAMQDDVYAICFGGYEAGWEIAYEYATKKKKENGVTVEVQTDKVKGFEGRLLPKALVAGYFDTHKAIGALLITAGLLVNARIDAKINDADRDSCESRDDACGEADAKPAPYSVRA